MGRTKFKGETFQTLGTKYDGLKELACNVVQLAANDLREELRKKKVDDTEIYRFRRFFLHSPWVEYSGINGKAVYERIMKEESRK